MRIKRGTYPSWRNGPRSRAGKAVLFVVAALAVGLCCARLIMLNAEVRPYLGWYWLIAVVGGIGLAVAVPWIFVLGFRSSARWAGWLLIGYVGALIFGMRYFLAVRFTPPKNAPPVLPPPPLRIVLQVAGLSAVTLTVVAALVLVLAVLVEIAVPDRMARWMAALRNRRQLS